MSVTKLGGATCARAVLQLPAWGRAWADVELTEATTLAGTQTLTIADASWSMTIVSGGVTDGGRARYRLVAGKGGWGKEIPKKAYQNDAGVSMATVLRDAASACGESVGALPTGRLGPHFARAKGTASSTPNLVTPRGWYVDAAGVTQFGARASATYTGKGVRQRVDLAAGVVELAVDELENLAPGILVDGHPAATDVEVEVDPKRITVRVYWAAALQSRRASAIERIVEQLFPWLRYCGTYEYRVVTMENDYRLNLQPVRVATGLPDLARVSTRPGVSGFRAKVAPGELVLVTFADHDPSRPQVIAHDAPDSPGWLPEGTVDLGDGGDYVALKSAVDKIQQTFDQHFHPTGVGPSDLPKPTLIQAQASSTKLKVL